MDVWPALPLMILSYEDSLTRSVDIVAVLECTDRVYHISIGGMVGLEFDIFLAAMQQPFPELTDLYLGVLQSFDKTVAVVPDSFLGGSTGSAPHQEYLELRHIPFPGLPKLLLSATHLRALYLENIPHSGYISPDDMVAALSTLTRLNSLRLEFESPRSCPDPASRRPSPSTRSVLPILRFLTFKGVSEYLEDLVACIDGPQLRRLDVTFFNDVVFDTPQLVRFISHTPKWKALEKADITLWNCDARVNFSSQTSRYGEFQVTILCKRLDWQVSSLEQICTSCLPSLSVLEDLYFEDSYLQPDWKDSVENGQWLELFRPFIAVKNLYLSEKFASCIAHALQELVESRTPDLLPALQNTFLKGLKSSGSVHESFGKLVAAQQVANHPIVISPWTRPGEG